MRDMDNKATMTSFVPHNPSSGECNDCDRGTCDIPSVPMTPPARKWSPQQEAIFNWFGAPSANRSRNLVVRARAGTGKTTTILEAINYAPEDSILLAAFNKKIAAELSSKLKNPKAVAKTLHGVGFGFVLRNWKGVKLDEERGMNIARRVLGDSSPDAMILLTKRLTSIAKSGGPNPSVSALIDFAYSYDLCPDEMWEQDGWTVERIAKAAHRCLDLAAQSDGTIDFDDMVWVPLRNRWVRGKYDLVVIDEAQDMNISQILLAQGICKSTGRIVVVGDDRQAIYAFRGADSSSIDRLLRELKADELGLTVTYRCPSSVVALAQTIVTDFVAAPSAPVGKVLQTDSSKLVEMAGPGSFVLSRKNAPLVGICLSLLKARKIAKINGKDIGKNMLTIVKKMKATSIVSFIEKLAKWEKRSIDHLMATKRKSAEVRAQIVADQAETLRALAEGLKGMKELEARIEELFGEAAFQSKDAIICSSVHRAKGLETDQVFVLESTLYPGGQRAVEEQNIHYVAITRAKRELHMIQGDF